MSHIDKSKIAKMPDNKKIKTYYGGAIHTITVRALKKQLKIKSGAKK